MTTTFLVMWSQDRLEEVVNLDDIEKYRMWNTLADRDTAGLGSIIGPMFAKARKFPEAQYEIYTILIANDGLTENEFRTLFDDQPVAARDLIRARGTKVYSEYSIPEVGE